MSHPFKVLASCCFLSTVQFPVASSKVAVQMEYEPPKTPINSLHDPSFNHFLKPNLELSLGRQQFQWNLSQHIEHPSKVFMAHFIITF